MRNLRSVVSLAVVVALAACNDSSVAPVVPVPIVGDISGAWTSAGAAPFYSALSFTLASGVVYAGTASASANPCKSGNACSFTGSISSKPQAGTTIVLQFFFDDRSAGEQLIAADFTGALYSDGVIRGAIRTFETFPSSHTYGPDSVEFHR